jgi:endoglucanase
LCVDATKTGSKGSTKGGSKPSGGADADGGVVEGADGSVVADDESGGSTPSKPSKPSSPSTSPGDPTPTSGPDAPNPDQPSQPDGPTPTTPDNPSNPDNPQPTAPSDTPVALHGKLHVDGVRLVDEHNEITQLKGVSSMWLNWESKAYAENKDALIWMRDNWNLQIIRAAMGVDQNPGDGAYLEDPDKAKKQVNTIVSNAIEAGVYVIIDWHDHHAADHESDAEAFFAEMAQKYADVPNVIYELFNEPLDVSWDSVLVPYHTAVSGAIRQYSDGVVVLGTPNWDQDVDVAAANPVSGTNLMYTLHFYACDHGSDIRAKGVSALASGLPIFVTEWGATPADGGIEQPIVCEDEANAWHDWINQEHISWAAWKLDAGTDSSSFFVSGGVPVDGGWTSDMLNGHAPYVVSKMKVVSEPAPAPTPSPSEPTPAPTGCSTSGSCATGDRMDCNADGDLIAGDCSGCSVLSCSGCCAGVGYFGATDVVANFTTDSSLVTSFSQSTSDVTLAADFTQTEQAGVISFFLDSAVAIDPEAFGILLTATGGDAYVSLENGSSGCLYPLLAGDTYVLLDVTYANCWGSALPGDLVNQINVRVQSASSGSASLSVQSIAF